VTVRVWPEKPLPAKTDAAIADALEGFCTAAMAAASLAACRFRRAA